MRMKIMVKSPTEMVKAIRMKKMATGGLVESMGDDDQGLFDDDMEAVDLGEEHYPDPEMIEDPAERRKQRIAKILFRSK